LSTNVFDCAEWHFLENYIQYWPWTTGYSVSRATAAAELSEKTLSVEKLLIFFAFYKEIWKKQKYISMNGLKIFFKTGVKACSISSSGCCCANTIEARFTTNGENAARNSKS
jgi:hypothetical protein